MKNVFYLCIVAALFTGCRSNKNFTSWKNVYEPVKTETPVVTEEVEVPAPPVPVVEKKQDKVVARQEEVKRTHGNEIKGYSVIVGSFGQEQNAINLRKSLIEMGYTNTSIMQNLQGMNRVAIASFDDEQAARNELYKVRQEHSQFSDAWLLIKKK